MAKTYSFGEWVKQRRKSLHLTQRELALQASCAVATIKKIESDERRPSPELAGLLAEALQVASPWRDIFIECARGRRPVDALPSPSDTELTRGPAAAIVEPAPQETRSSDLPKGTVTFLFTDIEGSSRLWEQHPDEMRPAMAQHDARLRAAVLEHGGQVVKMRGDGLHAVFASAQGAVAAAVSGQRALQKAEWDEELGRLKVRMGLHTGTAEIRNGDYFGPVVNRAARLRLFSPQQVAERLSDRFRLLTGGSRTAVPRQQTLQALIDWSYDLLEPEEKELFRRLSVFAGGWTFEAAEAIGEGLDVLELLDQLVNKSLVQVEEAGDAVRYRFLETIRQYARDRLFAAGEGEAVRDRHFAHMVRLAAVAERHMEGLEMKRIIAMLPEIDNFRLAIEWGLERDVETTVDLLAGAVALWSRSTGPPFGEIRRWIERAMTQLEVKPLEGQEDGRQRAQARVYLVASVAAMSTGEFEQVKAYATKAVNLARAQDDKQTLMAALGSLSATSAVINRGHLAEDRESYAAAEECLSLARELNSDYYKWHRTGTGQQGDW
jgi:class 3 adenylate cyclase